MLYITQTGSKWLFKEMFTNIIEKIYPWMKWAGHVA
jgi:hypothetical protein